MGGFWGEGAGWNRFEARSGDCVLSETMLTILARVAEEDRGLEDPTTMTPEVGRAQAEVANARWNRNMADVYASTDFLVSGEVGNEIPCRLITPAADSAGLIVFVHGGGWCFCSKETHEHAARILASAANAHILTFDYRLAPENPYPAGLKDCISVWQAVQAGALPVGGDLTPCAIAGDSAGANLALALMLHQIEVDEPAPDGGLLFYGVYDDNFQSRSYLACAEGPGLTREKMLRYWDFYTPYPALRESPFVSPLKAGDEALLELPPLYLNAAAIDPLRSDTANLVCRLSALGREDTYQLYPGVVHGFMQMNPVLAEARTAAEEAANVFCKIAGKMKTT